MCPPYLGAAAVLGGRSHGQVLVRSNRQGPTSQFSIIPATCDTVDLGRFREE